MTGVNINKIRHYAPGFNKRTTRLDADTSAMFFKAGNRVISSSERLIADVSVKAAMPNAGDTDNKKRGLQSEGQSKYVNIYGMVFDPNATKKEGQYLKTWITERERIDAMRTNDPVPNWGWVDRFPERRNGLEKPREAQATVTRYPVNPKTGKPMKNQGFNQEFKSLGRTIGEMNPGGKLMARAARAFGVVIDALGKFRCPPGTPAANRFTNERGEGCFDFSPAQLRNMVQAMTSAMGPETTTSQMVTALLDSGVTMRDIRDAYRSDGMNGLASLAKKVNIGFWGEKWNDASYRSQIPVQLRNISGLTMGADARMARIAQEKIDVVNDLAARYGITETDEHKKILEIYKAMAADPDGPFDPDQYALLFMGGDPDSHEEWVVENLISVHLEAINQKLGLGGTAGMLGDWNKGPRDPVMAARVAQDALDEYRRAKAAGEVTPLTEFIDAGIKRERDFRTGALEELLVTAEKNPEYFITPEGKKLPIIVDYSKTGLVGPGEIDWGMQGYAHPDHLLIGSGPAMLGHRDAPPPTYMDLYEASGGDIDDQWRAIASAVDADERLRAYAELWGTDLAATEGRGWRDFGAQTAAHELTHIGQYKAIVQYLRDTGEDVDSMNNSEIMARINDFMEVATPEILRDVFGVDIEDLIDKRLDALAGQYSQGKQQEALEILAELASATTERRKREITADFNYAKSVALLETLAEINANKKIGLIGDDPELDDILDKMKPLPPTTGGVVSPSGTGTVPTPPPGAPRPVRPSLPTSAPALPADAGKVRKPAPAGRRPSGRGGRAKSEPKGIFEKDRNGKIPTMIEEGRFTQEDILEFLYGEDGKGGLQRMLESVKNMRTKKDGRIDPVLVKRKELLNKLVDTMGLSFSELEDMALKVRNGESLSPEERDKLMNAIAHLRNGANEFKRKAEEAREKYANYEPVDTSMATGDGSEYDEYDTNRVRLEGIQKEIEMYESLFNRVGRGIAPAVHDILTMSEKGPYPPSLRAPVRPAEPRIGVTAADADGLASRQNARLLPEESAALIDIARRPDGVRVEGPDDSPEKVRELSSKLRDIDDVVQAYRRNGLEPPSSAGDEDLGQTAQAMSGLDKSVLPQDMVVEVEIEVPDSFGAGDTHRVDSIVSGRLITDSDIEPFERVGLASRSGIQTRAGIAGRLLGSRATRKIMEKTGVDPDKAELVQMMAEVAIGFSIGGPAGAIIPLARRGGRDVAEVALKQMVEKGWIDQSLAEKITRFGLDRIATDGLPNDIIDAAERTKEKLWTEDTKRRAIDIGSAMQERSVELAQATKEKLRNIRDRVFDRDEEDDPFSSPPSGPALEMPRTPETRGLSSRSGLASRTVSPAERVISKRNSRDTYRGVSRGFSARMSEEGIMEDVQEIINSTRDMRERRKYINKIRDEIINSDKSPEEKRRLLNMISMPSRGSLQGTIQVNKDIISDELRQMGFDVMRADKVKDFIKTIKNMRKEGYISEGQFEQLQRMMGDIRSGKIRTVSQFKDAVDAAIQENQSPASLGAAMRQRQLNG